MAHIRIEYDTNNMQKSFKAYKNNKRLMLHDIDLHWLTSSRDDDGNAVSDMMILNQHGVHRRVDKS